MTDTNQTPQSRPVPIEYAGQVVAWDSLDRNRIVGSGRSYDEARQAAQDAGVAEPLLERVPRADRTFIGHSA